MKNRADRDKRISTALLIMYIAAIVFVIAVYIKSIYNVEYFAVFESREEALIHILFSVEGLLLIGIAGMLLQTIIHEAGHLIFGLLTRYKFSSFSILLFKIYKKNGKFKFGFWFLPGAAGQCLMLPPDIINGKYPVQLYTFGGVLMNIFSGAAFIGLYFALREDAFSACAMLIIAVNGFYAALKNGIPMRLKIDNDGRNAAELSKSSDARLAYWYLLKINSLLNNGADFKDMPDEWFSSAESERIENGIEASVAYSATRRLLEKRQFNEADMLMARLLEANNALNDQQRNALICERTFYELVHQNRREVIEEMRTEDQREFLRKFRLTPEVTRTEYAYALLAEQNTEKAEEIRGKFEKRFGRYANDETFKLHIEMMELAKSKADQLHQIYNSIE